VSGNASEVETPVSLFERIASIGSLPDDSISVRSSNRSLVLSALLAAAIVTPWPIPYIYWGIYDAAAIPIFYVTTTIVGATHFARTKRPAFFRTSQIIMFTVLPLAVHFALGGFVNSSVVIVYASAGAVQALSMVGTRLAKWWFAAFVVVLAIAALSDGWLSESAPYVPPWAITLFFAVNIAAVSSISFVTLIIYIRSRDVLAAELEHERERSDQLLLNVLPPSIADRLKDGESPIADRYEHVAVLFADIVGSTATASSLEPDELVTGLNEVFGAFDALARTRGLEKVKTIGDAYMVVAGAPEIRDDGLEQIAELALEMCEASEQVSLDGINPIEMRFGIDVGPVVAGVIGTSKFTYDLYGDTVNTASRMESTGIAKRIQVTGRVRKALEGRYEFEPRGTIDVKGKGSIETFWLLVRLG
jgi:guanylate cyclase